MILESKQSVFSIADALAQILLIAFVMLIIVAIVFLFRTNKERRSQLNRIEKKIDRLEQETKSSK
ncbi:DUF4083 domain-containing protein [Sporosarcina sp. P21c]|nr:DUF4083 domain-containing protein [Sporosarcina sp. P16a]PIC83582.1 DUF4083 domain-containing protein [Sporosarcina sp. P1]PIC89337.1 DUF4083 domain-containing protein [Sporosarcina sp. P21c]PIC93068.1 DUF4083 domain-containing protein [Sporosarcina sp. P25]